MDQISAAPAAVVSSGGNRVAIGLHDPTLGWVEIKTQSTAGQIAAALVTSSNQTHQTLTAQLPSLAQFLSDREVKVNSVAVQQQATGGNNSGQAGSGEEQGSNAQPGRGGTSSGSNANSTFTAAGLGADEVFEDRPLSYISVRA
jgi:flagellar hook-length control protein FliK